ncbi:MAG: endolytic transglycosylase MltG [Candidatus Dormibacteria bacterium]
MSRDQGVRRAQGGRLGILFALIGVIVVLVAVAGATVLYGHVELEAAGSGGPVVITVRAGESLDQLADSLESQGLIKSALWFSAYARVRGVHLRAGRYQVDSAMEASEILNVLEGPQYCAPVKVVIPEGFTVDQIADRVASTAGLGISRQEYLAAVAGDSFAAPFLSMRPAGDTSLEGFLFPDTYQFTDCTSAHQVVQAQLTDFQQKALPNLPSSGTSAYADLITASIVQAEGLTGDFPKIASVVDNRLAISMDLQIDAIVMYGLHESGEAMIAADEAINTPYNSYLHAGLPPTPIDNPGVDAVQAAVHPASTSYLYYVSACGQTYYSTTEAVHQQQVQEYLGNPCP